MSIKNLKLDFKTRKTGFKKRGKTSEFYKQATKELRKVQFGFDSIDLRRKLTKTEKIRISRGFNNISVRSSDESLVIPRKKPHESDKKYKTRIHKLQIANGQKPSNLKGIIKQGLAKTDKIKFDKDGRLTTIKKKTKRMEIIIPLNLKSSDFVLSNEKITNAINEGTIKLNKKGYDFIQAILQTAGRNTFLGSDNADSLTDNIINAINKYKMKRTTEFFNQITGVLCVGELFF